ncbi:MAG: hypothetical protein JWM32_1280 [Verrucomicrobia bacterium]|nr:hypothetical protein [Verrucomicrobiota bacterium]
MMRTLFSSLTARALGLMLVGAVSARAQFLTVSGGGTIVLGQSATIVATPQLGIATAYALLENGVVVQTVGTFGIGGSGHDVGSPHVFTVTPTAAGIYVYTAQVALNLPRGHIDYAPSVNSVTLVVGGTANHAPTISWAGTVDAVGTNEAYTITAHGNDADGNLSQVNLWKDGAPFAFAGGGDGTDSTSSNGASDVGPATITFTAHAVDADGATSPTITHVVTVGTASFTLTTSAGPGGSVSPGGVFAAGATAIVTATPASNYTFTGWSGDLSGSANPGSVVMSADRSVTAHFAAALYTLTMIATAGGTVSPGGTYPFGTGIGVTASPDSAHDFAGWSGDASGFENPFPLVLDRNKSVTAHFSPKGFTLTTSATAGGSVTPGGTYPFGTMVTVTATSDITHAFASWSGDTSGSVPTVGVLMDRAKAVVAHFDPKATQSIDFTPPGDHVANAPPFVLVATSTSGLPITFTVLSGPATLTGNTVQVTGPGTVTIEASQPGDDVFLPAPPVTASFNVTSPVILKYQTTARTLLDSEKVKHGAPLVVPIP